MHLQKRVVYRPGSAIGIGHLLCCLAGYYAIAQAIGAHFVTTLKGTVFEPYGNEGDFLSVAFTRDAPPECPAVISYSAVRDAVAAAEAAQGRAIVIGRADMRARPAAEFPWLDCACFLDRLEDVTRLTPATLAQFDLIYVDSVAFRPGVLSGFPIDKPLVRLRRKYVRHVHTGVGTDRYIAVHARHGNGEFLGRRIAGEEATFLRFLRNLTEAALEARGRLGVGEILTLSDNAETAATLASLTGGRAVGADNLPDRRFQEFLRDGSGATRHRIDKILFDFAVLGGARHVIAGRSLFAEIAHLTGNGGDLTLVDPDDEAGRT